MRAARSVNRRKRKLQWNKAEHVGNGDRYTTIERSLHSRSRWCCTGSSWRRWGHSRLSSNNSNLWGQLMTHHRQINAARTSQPVQGAVPCCGHLNPQQYTSTAKGNSTALTGTTLRTHVPAGAQMNLATFIMQSNIECAWSTECHRRSRTSQARGPISRQASHENADNRNDSDINVLGEDHPCVDAEVLVQEQAHCDLSSNHLRSTLKEQVQFSGQYLGRYRQQKIGCFTYCVFGSCVPMGLVERHANLSCALCHNLAKALFRRAERCSLVSPFPACASFVESQCGGWWAGH